MEHIDYVTVKGGGEEYRERESAPRQTYNQIYCQQEETAEGNAPLERVLLMDNVSPLWCW